jgi:hypothetical protein
MAYIGGGARLQAPSKPVTINLWQDDQHCVHSKQKDERKCTVLYGREKNFCPPQQSQQCLYPLEVSLPELNKTIRLADPLPSILV